jgi:glycine oxidase
MPYTIVVNFSKKIDFVVVGNGAIGLFAAIKLKEKFPDKSVVIVGPIERDGSASAAAGAMANVFAEYESVHDGNYSNQDLFLKIGILGQNKWKEFLLSHAMKQVITAPSTLVYLQKNASSFEQLNFDKVREISGKHNVLQDLTSSQIEMSFPATFNSIESVIKIEDEFAICTRELFISLTELANHIGIIFIHDLAKSIVGDQEILLLSGGMIQFNNLVVAAGAQSADILQEFDVVPMLQGVGTAVIFDANSTKELNNYKSNVIRTVNRGGAQCGIHLVPRSDGTLYLGAGNYVASPGESPHRIETIRYLFDKVEKDILGKEIAYDLTGTVIKGYRPRALDGFPMIGPVKKNDKIFVATATNRVGLTWAPEIAEQIVDWALGNPGSEDFKHWHPNRKLISFGTPAKAKEYFVNSRIGAALEHRLVENNPSDLRDKAIALQKISEELHLQSTNLVGLDPKQESINPDNWNVIISKKITCTS